LAVSEFAKRGKASEEILALWRWVSTQLSEESSDHGQTVLKAAC